MRKRSSPASHWSHQIPLGRNLCNEAISPDLDILTPKTSLPNPLSLSHAIYPHCVIHNAIMPTWRSSGGSLEALRGEAAFTMSRASFSANLRSSLFSRAWCLASCRSAFSSARFSFLSSFSFSLSGPLLCGTLHSRHYFDRAPQIHACRSALRRLSLSEDGDIAMAKPDIQFISGMPNLCEASKCEGGCISKNYFPKAQAIKHRALQNSSQTRVLVRLKPSQPQPSTLMTPKRHKWLVLCTRASFARMKSTSRAIQQSGRGCRL